MSQMPSRSEVEYYNGYDRGRTMCLVKGPDAAKRWLHEHRDRIDSYREGFAQAVWDYDDANGLPHDPLLNMPS